MDIITDYKAAYQKKMARLGASPYTRAFKHKERAFISYFENTLNRETCLVDGVEAEVVFQDHSQANNKDLSDDKYIVTDNSVAIHIGSYVNWREKDWLVFTEEEKTIRTHQQLKIKTVNWRVKWIRNKQVVNGGMGYGAHVQNQTLYTLGVAFVGDHLAMVDGKMMMYIQSNPDTRSIKIGQRIFIGEHIYKILFADIVSRSGLINFLMEQDTMTEYDNLELGVADYWREFPIENESVPEIPPLTSTIEGKEAARIGSLQRYSINGTGIVSEWVVESDGAEQPVYIQERDGSQINLLFKDDFRFVGSTMNIIAILSDSSIISLPVRIIKKF